MGYRNALYDPHWKTACEYHQSAMQRAEREMARLAAGVPFNSASFREAEAAFKRHVRAYKETYKTRLETIPEYTEWLFWSFPLTLTDPAASIPVSQAEINNLRTVEDADAAWACLRLTDPRQDAAEALTQPFSSSR